MSETLDQKLSVRLLDARLLGANGVKVQGIVPRRTGYRLLENEGTKEVRFGLGTVAPLEDPNKAQDFQDWFSTKARKSGADIEMAGLLVLMSEVEHFIKGKGYPKGVFPEDEIVRKENKDSDKDKAKDDVTTATTIASAVGAAMKEHLGFLDSRLGAGTILGPSPNKAPKKKSRGSTLFGSAASSTSASAAAAGKGGIDPRNLFFASDDEEEDDETLPADPEVLKAYNELRDLAIAEFNKPGSLGPKSTLALGPEGAPEATRVERGIPSIYYGGGGVATAGCNITALSPENVYDHFMSVSAPVLKSAMLFLPNFVANFKKVQRPGLRFNHARISWDIQPTKPLKKEFLACVLCIKFALANRDVMSVLWTIPTEQQYVEHMRVNTAAQTPPGAGAGTGSPGSGASGSSGSGTPM